MPVKVINLESVPSDAAGKLEAIGVGTTDELLPQAASATSRQRLADLAGLETAAVLRLARIADLCRIVGLIEPHTLLLDAVGVGNVRLLRDQDASLLVKALRRKNVELQLVRSVPPESTIARWVDDAKALPIVLDD
jgi:hypothetical protein